MRIRRRLRTPLLLILGLLAVALIGVTQMAPAAAQDDRRPMTFDDVAAIDELHDGHARVLRLYWTYFDRRPDAGGALFWLDKYER